MTGILNDAIGDSHFWHVPFLILPFIPFPFFASLNWEDTEEDFVS